MSREHQQQLQKRAEILQNEAYGVESTTIAFFKYSALVAAASTAGVVGLGYFVPAIARLTPAKKLFIVTIITPVPGYIIAEHEITKNAIARAAMRHTYNIRESDVERARELYNQKPFFYRHRTEMTVTLAALGLTTGMYAAYNSRHLTTQQKWVKTRMWFSTAGIGMVFGLAMIWASSSQEQKETMEDSKFQRYRKSTGV